MKDKILNFLTVSLVTLLIISPGLIVFTVVWERHLELVSAQNYLSSSHKGNIGFQNLGSNFAGIKSQRIADTKFWEQRVILEGQYRTTKILLWLLLFAPISLGVGIFSYEKYLIHRQKVLEKQIHMLERMWQLTIEK